MLSNCFWLNEIDFSIMPRLIENQRLRAISMLQPILAQDIVARQFGVLDNLVTLGSVNVHVVHMYRHVSMLST
jgi:hypothetical protein